MGSDQAKLPCILALGIDAETQAMTKEIRFCSSVGEIPSLPGAM